MGVAGDGVLVEVPPEVASDVPAAHGLSQLVVHAVVPLGDALLGREVGFGLLVVRAVGGDLADSKRRRREGLTQALQRLSKVAGARLLRGVAGELVDGQEHVIDLCSFSGMVPT